MHLKLCTYIIALLENLAANTTGRSPSYVDQSIIVKEISGKDDIYGEIYTEFLYQPKQVGKRKNAKNMFVLKSIIRTRQEASTQTKNGQTPQTKFAAQIKQKRGQNILSFQAQILNVT